MGFVDYYDVLQVSPRADAEVIEKAYRVLISRHHPDKGGDTRHAQRLNEAHDVLGDPDRRAAYNREWARHRERAASPTSHGAGPEAAVPQGSARGARPLWTVGWVVGLALMLLGAAFIATGSAFVGLLLAVLGVAFIFNLSGLWLLVALLAVGAGIVARHGLKARRSAS